MAARISSNRVVLRRRATSGLIGNVLLGICVLSAAHLIISEKNKSLNPPTPSQAATTIITDFDSIQLMVPSEPVPAGTMVKDIKFDKISFPKHQIPRGAISSVSQFSDSIVVAALPAKLPLFEENLSKVGHIANPVLDKIPLGMRAMTIRVDATSAVEGWAGSGSVVDILLVEKDRTSVVAEKVRILSAERSVAPVEGRSAPTVPSTVTLLVTQEQCLAINTAIPMGKIAFALRSSRDEESWSDTEFNSSELLAKQIFEKDKSGNIKGVIAIKDDDKEKAFALTDGKWIKTEVMPQGFFVNGDR